MATAGGVTARTTKRGRKSKYKKIAKAKTKLIKPTITHAIVENLGHLFEFISGINRIIVGFGWMSLPNCCGVLGIEKFVLEGPSMGENGSLLVQALVDSEGKFLDMSADWPGCKKPEDVLKCTNLFLGVECSEEYLHGPSFELSSGNSIPLIPTDCLFFIGGIGPRTICSYHLDFSL